MNRRRAPAYYLAGIVILFFLGFLFSCGDSPTDQSNDPGTMTGNGEIDPQAERDFLLSNVDLGEGFRGGLEIWALDLTAESDSVVSFDLVLVNKTDRDLFPPIHFVITRIVPNTVSVLDADGFERTGEPFFDVSGELGEDGVLSPDEASGRVRVGFGWPEPMAFSIGFRITIGEAVRQGVIAGVVFDDRNGNGRYDEIAIAEPGVPNVPVVLRPASGDSASARRVHTDRFGRYGFEGLRAGVYEVTALGIPGMAFTTPNPILVTLVALPDGTVSNFTNAHFGIRALVPPFERIFGPVPVGPGSRLGTRVDSLFVVEPQRTTDVRLPDRYFVRVEPPMLMGPRAIYIDRASVSIDEQPVFKSECRSDSLCLPPFVRALLEPPGLEVGEHMISIEVLGNEGSFLLISIEREEGR